MSDFLSKIASYNIFNYLLPGILFVVLAQVLTPYSFAQDDIIIGVFVYYFIGMVISRLGSLIIEPLFKATGFLKFQTYEEFVRVSKNDTKLDTLSETNNTYRTFCALFLSLIGLKIYELIEQACPVLQGWGVYTLLGVLLLLFLFSYRKQTQYISKRITTQN